MASTERILEIEGKRILICHGHTCSEIDLFKFTVCSNGKEVDVALFGHTHAFYQNHNGVIMMNQGMAVHFRFHLLWNLGIDEDS